MKLKVLFILVISILFNLPAFAGEGEGYYITATVHGSSYRYSDEKEVEVDVDDPTLGFDEKNRRVELLEDGRWVTTEKHPYSYQIRQWVEGSSKKQLEKATEEMARKVEENEKKLEESGSLPSEMKEGSEAADRDVTTIVVQKDNITEEKQKQLVKSLQEKNQSFSVVKGDPVRLTTGEFVTFKTELELEEFSITRNYRSFHKENSLFGRGFYSSLDMRIIRGVRPDSLEELTDAKRLWIRQKDDYENKKKSYEDSLSLLNRLILDFSENKREAEESLRGLERALLKADHEKMKSAIKSNITAAKKVLTLCITERDKLIRKKQRLEASCSYLKNQEEKVNRLYHLYLEAERTHSQSELHRELNSRVVNDSPIHLSHTGLNTFTYVDENSFPHVFIIPEGLLGEEGVVESGYSSNGQKGIPSSSGELTLFLKSGGEYQLQKTEGTLLFFNIYGQLSKWISPSGKEVRLNYSEKGTLLSLEDERMRRIEVETAEGRITSLTDPSGNTILYKYDSHNRLVQVTDRLGYPVQWEYDGMSSRLKRIIKPDGSFREYHWEFIEGLYRVVSTVDEEKNRESFSYDFQRRCTTYTSPSGEKTHHYYNDENRETAVEYSDGSREETAYSGGEKESFTSVIGHTTRFIEQGPLKTTVFHDNTREIREYDSEERLISFTDREGNRSEYAWQGNLLKEIHKPGNRSEYYDYNSQGDLISLKKTEGDTLLSEITLDYSFSDTGHIKTITDSDGVVVYEHYDLNDYLTEIRNRRGEKILSFSYDPEGRITEKVWPDGSKEEYYYSSRKDLILFKNRQGVYTRYFYNKSHGLTQKVILSGNAPYSLSEILQKEFTPREEHIFSQILRKLRADGKVKEERSGWGDETGTKLFFYDSRSRLTGTLIKETGDAEVYTLDRGGRVLQWAQYHIKDPAGFSPENRTSSVLLKERSFTYLPEETTLLYEDGTEEKYRFNPYGEITSSENPRGAVTEYLRSPGSLLIKDDIGTVYHQVEKGHHVITGTENETVQQYTPGGRLKKVIYPSEPEEGEVSEEFFYNDLGQLHKKRDIRGAVTQYILDNEGNIIKEIPDEGAQISYFYRNGLLTEKHVKDRIWKYSYNEGNQILSITDPMGQATVFHYSPLGFRTGITDGEGNSFFEKRDATGRLLEEINEEGEILRYKYTFTPQGMIKETLKEGEITGRKEYFNSRDRLVKTTDADGVSVEYSYTPTGKLSSHTIASSSPWLWHYDSRDRLIKEVNHQGYEKNYTYDNQNRLITETGFGTSVPRTHRYNIRGKRIYTDFGDGTFKSFTYSPAGDLLSAENPHEKLIYTWNRQGNLTGSSSSLTEDRFSYYYDDFAKRVRTEKNSSFHTAYTYGKNSELLSLRTPDSYTEFFYDSLGRENKRVTGNSITHKTYDRAGRMTSVSHKLGSAINRAEAYLYNKKGQRVFKIDERGRITTYTYTPGGRLKEENTSLNSTLIQRSREERTELGLKSSRVPWTPELPFSREETDSLKNAFSLIAPPWKQLQLRSPRWSESLSYDNRGNRIQSLTPHGTVQYKYNEAGQLIQAGHREYFYDSRGNLIKEVLKNRETLYSYNNENRMTGFQKDQISLEFTYDALSRRNSRKELHNGWKQNNNTSSLYTYDGLSFNMTGEERTYTNRWNDTQELNHWYKGNEVLTTSERRWYTSHNTLYFHDAQGSVIGAREYGTTRPLYYDASGNDLSSHSPWKETYFNYTGKPADRITGLSNYGFRDYSPTLSRFTTIDPIKDGNNWYEYCGNDAVNFVDLWGLDTTYIYINDRDSASKLIGGSHVAIYFDEFKGPEGQITLFSEVLYDPSGSYESHIGGPGAEIMVSYENEPDQQKANLESYINYHIEKDDSTVTTFTFDTTPEEEAEIFERVEKLGAGIFLDCANYTSRCVKGIGPFEDFSKSRTPSSLSDFLS